MSFVASRSLLFLGSSSQRTRGLYRTALPSLQLVRAARGFSAGEPVECRLERLDGDDKGIAVIQLDRPKSKNALGKLMLQQLGDRINEANQHSDIRCVIVRSMVDGVFCAGADLKERAQMSEKEVGMFVTKLRETMSNLEKLVVPSIAVIDGAALGGGLELALCCDMRVAGANAKIGLPETKLAIIPGAGGTQRLPRLIGLGKAKELIFTGRALSAQDAESAGIVNYAVNGPSGYEKALALAREILPNGPVAIKAAKGAMDQGIQKDLETGLLFEQHYYAKVIPTEDRLEGLKAFREKRKPVYTGK